MSILLLMLLASLGSVAFVCLGVVAVRRLLRQGVGKGHNEVLAAVFQAGGTLYAVFLAFLVVAVWEFPRRRPRQHGRRGVAALHPLSR
jgi:drug/metabolite transporter (DMT)-like permease